MFICEISIIIIIIIILICQKLGGPGPYNKNLSCLRLSHLEHVLPAEVIQNLVGHLRRSFFFQNS